MQWIVFLFAFSAEGIPFMNLLLLNNEKKFQLVDQITLAGRLLFVFKRFPNKRDCNEKTNNTMRILVCIGGMGIVNATQTTQLVIDWIQNCNSKSPIHNNKYRQTNIIKAMFFSGIAGNLNNNFKIGDIVIPALWTFPLFTKFLPSNNTQPLLHNTNKNTRFVDTLPDFPLKLATTSKGLIPNSLCPLCDSNNCQCTCTTNNINRNTILNEKKIHKRPKPSSFGVPSKMLQQRQYKTINDSYQRPKHRHMKNKHPTVETNGSLLFNNMAVTMQSEILVKPFDVFETPLPQQFLLPVDKTLRQSIEKSVARRINLIDKRLVLVQNNQPTIRFNDNKNHDDIIGVSSDSFINNAEYADFLFDVFHASVVDMESAAFVKVCISNQIPCLVIRVLSDLAGRASIASQQIETDVQVITNNLSQFLGSVILKI